MVLVDFVCLVSVFVSTVLTSVSVFLTSTLISSATFLTFSLSGLFVFLLAIVLFNLNTHGTGGADNGLFGGIKVAGI